MDFKKEIEKLKRDLEETRRDLRTKAESNPHVRNPKRLSDQAKPPTISSITLAPGLGSLTARINPAQFRDLHLYEVQVSDSPFLCSPTTFEVVEPRLNITEEITSVFGDDFYIRARAISRNGRRGDFSKIYASAPKLVDTVHLELESASALASLKVIRGSFYLDAIRTNADNINTFSETAEALLTVDFGEISDIRISTTYAFYINYSAGHEARTTLRFDNADQTTDIFKESVSSNLIFHTNTLMTQIPNVPEGTHSIDIKVEVEAFGAGDTLLTPDSIESMIHRAKR